MASRKRPHDATKPETPTNGLNSSLQDIDLHNGSNSSLDDVRHNNGDSNTMSDQYAIKNVTNRPVSSHKLPQRRLGVMNYSIEIKCVFILIVRISPTHACCDEPRDKL